MQRLGNRAQDDHPAVAEQHPASGGRIGEERLDARTQAPFRGLERLGRRSGRRGTDDGRPGEARRETVRTRVRALRDRVDRIEGFAAASGGHLGDVTAHERHTEAGGDPRADDAAPGAVEGGDRHQRLRAFGRLDGTVLAWLGIPFSRDRVCHG